MNLDGVRHYQDPVSALRSISALNLETTDWLNSPGMKNSRGKSVRFTVAPSIASLKRVQINVSEISASEPSPNQMA
eukprot:11750431-Karenia_brevis.AAC.1